MSLLIEIDRCLRHTGIPPTKFGRVAVNDPRLVGDMRRGRQVGPANQRRIMATIAQMLAALRDRP